MAITVEGTYTSTSSKTTISTITNVFVSGTNMVIYVFLSHHQKSASGGKLATNVIWKYLFAEQEFERIGYEEYNEEIVEIWRLIGPTFSPDSDIGIIWDGNNANWDGSCHAAIVLSNVDQVTPDDGFNSSSATSTSPYLNIATTVGDLCYGVVSVDDVDPTENGDGTSQWNLHNDMNYGDGVSYVSTDGNTNFDWIQISADWATAGISINEAISGCVPQTNSRIADDSISWQGDCDVDIVDWVKTNEFILATWATGGDDGNKNFKLQWKESGGSFADVGADTEVCWGTGTSLVDGNTVSTTSGCLSSTESEENEGDNAAVLDTMGVSDIGEIQWALGFGSGAQDGITYEFQLVNTSDTLTEVCSCSITTFSLGGYAKGIDRGINRGIL